MLKEDMFDYYKDSIQKSREYKRMALTALKQALKRLDTAVQALLDICSKPVPPDKIPEFQIFDGITWPHREGGNHVSWREITLSPEGRFSLSDTIYNDATVERLFAMHKLEPEKLVQALRVLEAAEAWCYERMRYPMQVLGQNPELKEFLEARAVVAALDQGDQ